MALVVQVSPVAAVAVAVETVTVVAQPNRVTQSQPISVTVDTVVDTAVETVALAVAGAELKVVAGPAGSTAVTLVRVVPVGQLTFTWNGEPRQAQVILAITAVVVEVPAVTRTALVDLAVAVEETDNPLSQPQDQAVAHTLALVLAD